MTTLINKESTQHYVNKMVLAENRKVGSKNLPTTLNEIDALIDEMKTYFDAEYDSALDMELENNENVFSVGTGIDINKRSEVENSFTDVELNGNSLVNLYPKPKRENYGNITGGVSFNGEKINIRANGTYQNIFLKKGMLNLKPSTTYTLIINISKNTLVGRGSGSLFVANTSSNEPSVFSNGSTLSLNALGIYKQILTTRSSFENVVYDTRCFLKMDCTDGEIEFTYILLEGDWTNKPIPQYFEGMKSVGEKEDGNHKISILSCNGGNIISNPRYKRGYYVDYRNGNEREEVTYSCTDYIKIEPNREIRVVNTNLNIAFYDSNKNYIKRTLQDFIGSNTNFKTITPSNASYVRFSTPNEAIGTEGCFYGDNIGDINTEIRIDKKEISLNEPLRGLPNGVKDTIEKINGEWKIIRRCVQIILNGTEYWNHENPPQEDGVNTVLFSSSKILNAKDFPQLCDRFIAKKSNLMLNSHPDSEGVGCWSAKNNVNIRINKSRLSTVDSAGFKTWLSQNPTKVLFELATPIIEDISPITLQCWKNGVISIDDVLPVETNHTVALNKSAQIKNNIKELTTLRKRVEDLESFYDKAALEQAYQLDLINHSYELDYNR